MSISSNQAQPIQIPMASSGQNVDSEDAAGLRAIGKAQAFDRRLNIWSIIGIGVCVSATWEGISASIFSALTNGGSVTMIWGYVLTAAGSITLAASLAELASIWPSSGAQYHWVASLCSESVKPIAAWYAGWLSLASAFLGGIGSSFAVALAIQTYAMICNPSYVPERWHVTMIYIMVITLITIFNIFGAKGYHLLNISLVYVHVIFFLVTMIVLLVTTSPKHDAKYVFTNFTNYSGWSSDGVSFCIGLMSLATGFVGIEAPAHFAEEMLHAPKDLPKAIFWTTTVSAVLTFPWIVVLLFCMGQLEELLESPIAMLSPMTQIFLNSTGKVGVAVFLNLMATIVGFVSALNLVGACSRTIFAMARDRAFPERFARVHSKWDVPVWSVLITGSLQAAFGLIYIGNATAFYGVMSGLLITQMCSYCLPIGLHLYYRRIPGRVPIGMWTLKSWGILINILALCWTIFLIIFLCFPLYQPVTSETMNYAVVILGGVFLIATILYFIYGRGRFYGPISELVGVSPATIDNPILVAVTGKEDKLEDV